MQFKHKSYLLIVSAIVFFYACVKTSDFSTTPLITYKEFKTFGKDSAYFYYKFQDGDGDIGLDNGDTNSPFDSKSKYYYNLIMTYYFKETDGSFHTYFNSAPLVNDTQRFEYRILNITPKGQNKVVDGEMRVVMYAPFFITGHKSVKYSAYIYDRALHQSNTILTPEIVVSQ